MALLRAVTDRLIPGQPEDPTPGALQAGVPEAIDLLLGAFEVDTAADPRRRPVLESRRLTP